LLNLDITKDAVWSSRFFYLQLELKEDATDDVDASCSGIVNYDGDASDAAELGKIPWPIINMRHDPK
jgi:hypothetical protein